ncbi:alpha/beta hydrolase [Pseudomonas sp. C27(2019)]|uniref:alpha/beta family hydrolase n=1 Tax=Pseudomonas sp. C27(2019) TaxID=2604941 RepID=UPI001244C3CD|nr:alpha/beta family hydrolase [Pseudomonas sp. C27(2019)]QEY58398.1 alpha/beta hydrolase [Pseudomonas sp. C27(2019)]
MSILYANAENPCCTLILAHGAGAPMDSEFMETIVQNLLALDISVVRFEFPYMALCRLDAIRRPPNKMAVLQDTWREVYNQVRAQSTLPIVIAGKSMGGRVASMLVDELQPLALICLGYPFYPAKKLDKPRTEHLLDLRTPTLIVQGERDALGCREVVEGYRLSSAIEIEWMALADHDLKPLQRSGCTQAQYLQHAACRIKDFVVRQLR